MTQLKSLGDLVELGIQIRSLSDIASEAPSPGTYRRYFLFEQRLIAKGRAVNFESYLLQEYQFNQRGLDSIGKDLKVSPRRVYRIIKKLGIPTRSSKESLQTSEAKERMSETKKGRKNPMYGLKGKNHLSYGKVIINPPSREELSRIYIEEGRSIEDVGEFYTVSKTTVVRWLHEYRIKRSKEESRKVAVNKRKTNDGLKSHSKEQEREI
ncbi:MAG: IS630 transposase-related protein [Candidatus Pacearchaeota archaeon]|jgi:transposase